MASVSPLARVDVAPGELDILFLVVQYLRELGLSTSVVALLRESGVDPFWLCGPSREVALLREWVFQGEWTRVRSLLEPLRRILGDHGFALAIALINKQELLEQFYLVGTTSDTRRDILDKLQTSAHVARLTKQELQQCVQTVQRGEERKAPWSLDEARLACFGSLVPLFRDEIGHEDEESKYQTMPRRQLVALLNDALLLHKSQTGGEQDVVSVKASSRDRVEGMHADEVSSLRLTTAFHHDQESRMSNPLTRSINLSRAGRKHEEFVAKPDLHHVHSPLSMSMDFSTRPSISQRQQRSHDTQDPISKEKQEEEGRESSQEDGESSGLNAIQESISVVDAETQTDEPVEIIYSESSHTKIHTLVASTTEQLVDSQDQLTQSNQEADQPNSGHIEEPILFNKSSLSNKSSAPLEAWSSSVREKEGQSIVSARDEPQQELTSSVNKDGSGVGRSEDQEEPSLEIGLEEQDEDDHVDSESEEPPRSYSQLTLDSLVRARVVAEVREAQAIRAMDISPDGSEMVIGTNARALRVFDLTEPLANMTAGIADNRSFLPLLPVSLERHKHHSSPIYTACYNHAPPSQMNPLIATGAAESSIKVLSRWSQREVWIRGHSGKSRALQFVSPSLLSSAASGDLVIRIWDVETTSGDQCVQRLDGHVGEIQAMAVSSAPHGDPIGQCLVSSSMDRTVRLWDLRAAKCVRVIARTASPAFALALHEAAASVLATGHQDGTLALWDLRTSSSKTAKPLATVSHHQDECRAVSWSPDGHWLLSGSFDGTLCLLDASDSLSAVASFHQHEDKILQATWHPTVPAVVTTGADKLVKLWGFS